MTGKQWWDEYVRKNRVTPDAITAYEAGFHDGMSKAADIVDNELGTHFGGRSTRTAREIRMELHGVTYEDLELTDIERENK